MTNRPTEDDGLTSLRVRPCSMIAELQGKCVRCVASPRCSPVFSGVLRRSPTFSDVLRRSPDVLRRSPVFSGVLRMFSGVLRLFLGVLRCSPAFSRCCSRRSLQSVTLVLLFDGCLEMMKSGRRQTTIASTESLVQGLSIRAACLYPATVWCSHRWLFTRAAAETLVQ